MIWLIAAGCAEYSVTLEQESDAPLPVVIAYSVEMPVGIVVTVAATAWKNDEELGDRGNIELEVDDPGVLEVAAIQEDDDAAQWAFAAVSPGVTSLWPTVNGHDAEPIEVLITEQ